MCNKRHCSRVGCNNSIQVDRTDSFCSNSCKKANEVIKLSSLAESYKELRISHSEFIGKRTKVKKTCKNEGCKNDVKKRGSKAKFCSLKCARDNSKKRKMCTAYGCNNIYTPIRPKSLFCSRKCYLKSIRPPEKECENKSCKTLLVKNTQKKFCSKKCSNEHKFGNLKKLETCQKTGCENKLSAKRSARKFCSHECFKLDRYERNNFIGRIKLVKSTGNKYPRRYIRTDAGWKMLSVLTWEKENGPLPKGHVIVFKDENVFNDQDINNLMDVPSFNKISAKRRGKKESVKNEETNYKETFTSKNYLVI